MLKIYLDSLKTLKYFMKKKEENEVSEACLFANCQKKKIKKVKSIGIYACFTCAIRHDHFLYHQFGSFSQANQIVVGLYQVETLITN